MADKHTSGTWEWDGEDSIYSPSTDVAVATLLAVPDRAYTQSPRPYNQGEAIANARLISAAPELLAALIEMEEAPDDDSRYSAAIQARAAIVKAEGR